MKRLPSIVVIPMVCIPMWSCGWEGSGEVVDKQYTPETEIDGVDTCTTKNGVTKCSDDDIEISESWELQIKDSAGDTHWVTVEKRTWDEIAIGATYSTED